MKKRLFLFALIFILLSVSVLGVDRIVSNSEDWRDVYSIVQYANFIDTPSDFLVSRRHSTLLYYALPEGGEIQIITSSNYPFVIGYESILNGRGFDAQELIFDNINLELAQMLLDIKKFIIIDDSYGYNAISVAPYAQISDSYVLFADRDNIGDIEDFLAERDPEHIIIYGHVNREVKEALATYDPEIINVNGDRFDNNIEIVKKYMEINPTKQVLLTNGEFIEQELMTGAEPILFIGASNVPEQVREYIEESGIEVGVLIGNQYVGTATTIKRQAGISVFVKFARSARVPGAVVSPVEGLDLFYLPSYRLNLEIVSIVYNQLTNQIEVTYRNNVDLGTYFLGTYRITDGDGTVQTRGEFEPIFIDGLEYRTVVHDVDPMTGDITARISTVFGDSLRSLEYLLEAEMTVDVIEVLDGSQIEIVSVTYDKTRGQFIVEVKNIGEVDTYVDIQLEDIVIAGDEFNFGSDKVVFLKKGETKKIRINVDLEEEDFEDNERISVVAYYGEREQNLVKILRAEYEVAFRGVGMIIFYVVGGIVIILILILLFFFLIGRRRKKCPNCKHKNPARRHYCEKCGTELKKRN